MSTLRNLVFSLTKKDFRVDKFRAGGPGGQNQNKRDTGVRITHIESGIAAESRVFRTQPENRKEAFKKLIGMKEFKKWCRHKADAEWIDIAMEAAMDKRNIITEGIVNGKWTPIS